MNPFFRVLLSFFLFSNTVVGQPNLIYNGSFNQLDTCINGVLATQNIDFWGWYSYSSADIYTPFDSSSNCLLSGFTLVPYNRVGFQYPVSGRNYAGIQTYAQNDFKDYISGKIIGNLKNGKTYCGQMYVSLVDTCNTACHNMGMFYSSFLPTGSFGQNLNNYTPQITNNTSANSLSSQIDWTLIKGSFVANGTEQFITIGNFTPSSTSDTSKLNTPAIATIFCINASYYYLDDVSLIELKALHSNDTLVCPQTNFNQTLKAYPDFNSYIWSTGDTTRIINITQPGTYWVTASNWCGTVTDTIQVNVFNPFGLDQLLGIDKTLCDYQFPQRLRPLPQYENTFTNYLWSTGSDTSFTDVLLPGTYYVTAEHLCGFVTDTITLTLAPNPILNLGNDTTLCIGQQITLDAGTHTSYNWSNQSIKPSITINETGNYSVTVTNSFNCIASDVIQINFTQETAQLLPNDTVLYASAFPYIINLSNDYSNYQSNQFTIYNSQFTIDTEGEYFLNAIDAFGCLLSDSIFITLKEFELIIPSVLKSNQVFYIHNLPANSSLKIYNSLGQIVFTDRNYQNNFMPMLADALYLVEMEYTASGSSTQKEKYKGKLVIIK